MSNMLKKGIETPIHAHTAADLKDTALARIIK